MHIPEGVLSAPVLGIGAGVAAAGVGIGLYTMTDKQMVKVAVLSSAFFVASMIQVPMGPGSVHLVLAGLTGLLLGWAVFPAVAVALLLQAMLFGVGGLTTLGVNTVIMAVPGLICFYLFAPSIADERAATPFLVGCIAGVTALVLGTMLQAGALLSTGREFGVVAGAVAAAHVPIITVEGLVTGWTVAFLRQVRPDTFHLLERPPIPAGQPAP